MKNRQDLNNLKRSKHLYLYWLEIMINVWVKKKRLFVSSILWLASTCYAFSAPEDHGRDYSLRDWHITENPVVYGLAIVATIFCCLILIGMGRADNSRQDSYNDGNASIGCGVIGIILAVLMALIRCSMDK